MSESRRIRKLTPLLAKEGSQETVAVKNYPGQDNSSPASLVTQASLYAPLSRPRFFMSLIPADIPGSFCEF